MNSDLEQIASACENLARYIRQSQNHSSAVLIRAQADKILKTAQDYARERADHAAAKGFMRASHRSLRAKAHDRTSQFELSYSW